MYHKGKIWQPGESRPKTVELKDGEIGVFDLKGNFLEKRKYDKGDKK